MLILAIDTALDACAAAVLDIDAGRLIARESQAMKRGHAEALMPLIARVIKAAGIAFAALDRIAVTTGPGSFTGLRVGLSAARGIALAADKPVVGVTTLTAYAAPIVAENREQPIICAIDARHDHVYFQAVSGNGSYTTPTGYTLPTTGTVTGTYQWDASYSGDTDNVGATEPATSQETFAGFRVRFCASATTYSA